MERGLRMRGTDVRKACGMTSPQEPRRVEKQTAGKAHDETPAQDPHHESRSLRALNCANHRLLPSSLLVALARARQGNVFESATGRNKTKLQKRPLGCTFHQLKQLAEALHTKLREQLLFLVPLLEI